MDEKRRMLQYLHDPENRTPICWNCIHFQQHYIRWYGTYRTVGSGHCVYPRIKLRRCYDVCEHHSPRPSPKEPAEE